MVSRKTLFVSLLAVLLLVLPTVQIVLAYTTLYDDNFGSPTCVWVGSADCSYGVATFDGGEGLNLLDLDYDLSGFESVCVIVSRTEPEDEGRYAASVKVDGTWYGDEGTCGADLTRIEWTDYMDACEPGPCNISQVWIGWGSCGTQGQGELDHIDVHTCRPYP